jgi:hypothetical protein
MGRQYQANYCECGRTMNLTAAGLSKNHGCAKDFISSNPGPKKIKDQVY